MTSLPRGDAIALLKDRVAEAEQQQAELAAGVGQLPPETPGHVAELFGYWRTAGDNDIAWARGLIDRLSSGEESLKDLEAKAAAARDAYTKAAEKLSAAREKAAAQLSKAVGKELPDL